MPLWYRLCFLSSSPTDGPPPPDCPSGSHCALQLLPPITAYHPEDNITNSLICRWGKSPCVLHPVPAAGIQEAGTYHGFMVHLPGGKMPYMIGVNIEPTRKNFPVGYYVKSPSQTTWCSPNESRVILSSLPPGPAFDISVLIQFWSQGS